MSVRSTTKPFSLIALLKDALQPYIKGSTTINTIEELRDSEGYPVLRLSHNGQVASGQPVLWVQLKQKDFGAVDVLGQPSYPFTPHVCVVAYELDPSSQPYVALKDLALVWWELSRLGVYTEVKAVPNGSPVEESNVNSAPVVFTLRGTGT